ncbi:MAG: hypothetical protein RI912_1242, partial [Actinomycetota bacterium]
MCGRFVGNFAVDDLLAELAEAEVNASPAE